MWCHKNLRRSITAISYIHGSSKQALHVLCPRIPTCRKAACTQLFGSAASSYISVDRFRSGKFARDRYTFTKDFTNSRVGEEKTRIKDDELGISKNYPRSLFNKYPDSSALIYKVSRHSLYSWLSLSKLATMPPGYRFIHHTSKVQGMPKVELSDAPPRRQKKRRGPQVDLPYITPVSDAASRKHQIIKTIEIFDGLTLRELAQRLRQSVDTVESMLTSLGEPVESAAGIVNIDVAELIALEFGCNVKRVQPPNMRSDKKDRYGQVTTGELVPRPAVVTVMGHVDHGKTSLLDALRQTSVVSREAGGITQHIGAFVVNMSSGASLTFLDTPGHAAFSAMRARGAAVTDIVVLVVAADDGVMPQTLEALSHAQAANVPIVVAINKCDRLDANPVRVREQLGAEGVELEEIGGDVQVVEISATQKMGLDKLEEALLLQAELMDLRARIDGDAHAVVVEARLDRGQGPLATAIVRSGTLATSLYIVVGTEWGKIRSLRDTWGRQVKFAGPSMPVEIEGLKGLPQAGDEIIVVPNEERARKLSQARKSRMEENRLSSLRPKPAVTSEDPEQPQTEKVELVLIVKGDVQGTVQAVTQSLETLNNFQVAVNILHAGVGPVSQSDVDLAQTCGACIVGFNVHNMTSAVEAAARRANVDVRQHRVIYHLLEDVGQLIVSKAPGLLEPRVAGQAEVLDIFEIKGKGRARIGAAKIAGCRVFEGRIMRTCSARVLRSGDILFEGYFQSLKREKLDVEAVGHGNECGLIIQQWDDFQVGDIIQCVEFIRKKPRFVSYESGAVRIEC